MRPLRTLSLLLPVLTVMWLLPTRADACSCVQPPAPKAALKTAAAVFEGKVTDLASDAASHRLTATIAVKRVWKGAVTEVVEVTTIDAGSMCGFGFKVGESFVIYAEGDAGSLSTSMCSRSAPSSAAKDDVKALGVGKPPKPGKPEPSKIAAPTEPTKPEEPAKPETPAAPVEPTKPVTPVTPVEPSKPVAPTPPTTPAEPSEPPAPTPAKTSGCTIASDSPTSAAWLAALLLLGTRRRSSSRT